MNALHHLRPGDPCLQAEGRMAVSFLPLSLAPCGGPFLGGTAKPTPLQLPFGGEVPLDKARRRYFPQSGTASNPVRLFNHPGYRAAGPSGTPPRVVANPPR